MADVVESHRSEGPAAVRVAILTVSDTRTEATDASGRRIGELCRAAGHAVIDHRIVADEVRLVQGWVQAADAADVLIITGGTGVSPRDVTIEAVEPLFSKAVPGFGELFRMLSFAEIGSAALMSRAAAGLVGRVVVFALPGSAKAVDLAMTRLVIPELGHLVGQARKV